LSRQTGNQSQRKSLSGNDLISESSGSCPVASSPSSSAGMFLIYGTPFSYSVFDSFDFDHDQFFLRLFPYLAWRSLIRLRQNILIPIG
jgi:hypothetical protein